jgi:hypothetical protein
MFCLRARVNDASDYQRGVRLSTEKKFAAMPAEEATTETKFDHADICSNRIMVTRVTARNAGYP